MYLLDTMVISEMTKRQRNQDVERWLRRHQSDAHYLSVVTVGEIQRGIELLDQRDRERASTLRRWLEQVLNQFHGRLIAVDLAIARQWGQLTAQVGHAGTDVMIAATALQRNLTVVTRNVSHYLPTGAAVVDPYRC